jgi:hypothetical protein
MDLFSMGNYLKTLGLFRALTISAIGIRVMNARRDPRSRGRPCLRRGHDRRRHLHLGLSQAQQPHDRLCRGRYLRLPDAAHRIGEPEVLADRLREYILEFEEVYGELAYSFRRSRSVFRSLCAPHS